MTIYHDEGTVGWTNPWAERPTAIWKKLCILASPQGREGLQSTTVTFSVTAEGTGVLTYQWYKDGTAIPNATEDDYSEQNELQGAFQLRLLMNNDRYVWSEILTIQPAQTQAPSRIRIYNHNGYLFYQSEKETTIPSLPRGLYIIQIEQNGEQHIEKKLIP